MSILRVRTELTGFIGAPGLMTQYFSRAVGVNDSTAAQQAVDRVRDAMLTSPGAFPSALQWRVQGQVDLLEESNGQLVGSFNVTERSGVGTYAGGFGPAPAGACVRWVTDEFKRGRRVIGKTFLVPGPTNAYETNGTLTSAYITLLQSWADAMDNAGAIDLVFVVWSRPRPGMADGSKHSVVGNVVQDKAAVLRSRRQ